MHEILFDLSQMVNTWVITRGIIFKRTHIQFEVLCLTSNDTKPFCRWISTTCCIYSFEPFSYFSFTQKDFSQKCFRYSLNSKPSNVRWGWYFVLAIFLMNTLLVPKYKAVVKYRYVSTIKCRSCVQCNELN